MGPSWGGLGASCRLVRSYLESSRAILSDLGGHLELSWALASQGRPREAKILQKPKENQSKQGVDPFSGPPSEPSNEPLGALLGRSWGALGRSWAALGPLLGLSWGPLGPSWSYLEASEAHRKRKGARPQNIDFPLVFLRILASLGGSLAT